MPTVIPVRMHFNAQDLWFNPGKSQAKAGDHVIVATERGTEFGLATADPFNVPDNEMKGKGELKLVVRIATDKDVARAEELANQGEQAMPVFRKLVKESGLDIKPVGVEFLFGGEKAVFYFAAEDRVDFRDLVRDLAATFHQRVDMRQIGVRDEARLAGGYAPCGQELCCVRFGGQFQPVSIRMAKEQDLPLNSSKISGVCGRLMCCLRYEFDAYRDFKQRAPKKNNLIDTPLGKAKIVEYNTPKETLQLRLENGKSFTIALKDMTCSEGCCKRAKEQNIPLRPDTVTREALEALGTAEIAMQLAELDRANGQADGYALDMSLLDSQRTPRRRKDARPDAGDQAAQARKPRRQSKPAQQEGAQDAKKAGDGAQGDERRHGPRGGGMRPRRAPKAAAGSAEDPRRTSQQAERTDAGHPASKEGATEARRQRRQDNASTPRRTSGAGATKQTGAEKAGEPQRRTRRHHSVAGTGQPAPQPGQQTHDDTGGDRAGQGQRQGQARQKPQGQASQAGKANDARPPRNRAAEEAKQPRQQAERRRHSRPAQERPVEDKGGQPGEGRPAGQATRRRRRPGDRGGAGNDTARPAE